MEVVGGVGAHRRALPLTNGLTVLEFNNNGRFKHRKSLFEDVSVVHVRALAHMNTSINKMKLINAKALPSF